jgi:DNA polymerase-3 subunit epsilon
MKRHLIVVDVETNGLSPERHEAIEVAWWNLDTDERGSFIPAHNVSKVLGTAQVKALQVNRYIDRIPGAEQDHEFKALSRLHGQFLEYDEDNVDDVHGAAEIRHALAGSNPTFDAAMLAKLFNTGTDVTDRDTAPWHHRLWDLSAYAAGVLDLDELPGLARVCAILGVEDAPNHTAEGDVAATGACFKRLRQIAAERAS